MSSHDHGQHEFGVTAETARDFANVYACYLAVERSIISHRQDEDPSELQALVEEWAALARLINQRRSQIESEIITAPVAKR